MLLDVLCIILCIPLSAQLRYEIYRSVRQHNNCICYMKIYSHAVNLWSRILAEFRSHKAHRVHVRDKDLIKCLVVILVVVIWYMVTWTALNIDQLHNGTKLINTYVTGDLLEYVLCNSLWWDYVIEIGNWICDEVYSINKYV